MADVNIGIAEEVMKVTIEMESALKDLETRTIDNPTIAGSVGPDKLELIRRVFRCGYMAGRSNERDACIEMLGVGS